MRKILALSLVALLACAGSADAGVLGWLFPRISQRIEERHTRPTTAEPPLIVAAPQPAAHYSAPVSYTSPSGCVTVNGVTTCPMKR